MWHCTSEGVEMEEVHGGWEVAESVVSDMELLQLLKIANMYWQSLQSRYSVAHHNMLGR